MDSLRHILDLVPNVAAKNPALAWALAAGPLLAARVQVEGLRDGILTLRAADAADRLQIESVSPELRRALNRMLGANQVQRLEIVLGDPA